MSQVFALRWGFWRTVYEETYGSCLLISPESSTSVTTRNVTCLCYDFVTISEYICFFNAG